MAASLGPVRAAARSALCRAGRPAVPAAQRAIGVLATAPRLSCSPNAALRRGLATAADTYAGANVTPDAAKKSYKVVVVGGGTAGQDVAHMIAKTKYFAESPTPILVVDPSEFHDYQPGWTLVGGGVRTVEEGRRNTKDLAQGPGIDFLPDAVTAFEPENNAVKTKGGLTIEYDQLVVAPGVKTNWDAIQGLPEALATPESGVVSIYGYDTAPKVYPAIQALAKGRALFTQPAGVIKCAGAPQKILWMAWDEWRRTGRFSPDDPTKGVQASFLTGTPTMFSVPEYSAVLEELRQKRQIEGLFKTNLIKVDYKNKVATFTRDGQADLEREFDLLHVSPPMGPLDFIKNSPLAAKEGGFVDVDSATTQHKTYRNIWSLGDSSSLPTSKTVAAVTAQAPVTVANLLYSVANPGSTELPAAYDGYTSCPLITEYGKVLLAEFKYGAKPKETFGKYIDQREPQRLFWFFKREFFPRVYYGSMVSGTWAGSQGWINPKSLLP